MSTMLDFYQQHGIAPVKQDISDLKAHFARRAHLYQSLGLPPMAVEGNRVLEVGPGTGENAIYTASLHPYEYVAIEPNPLAAEVLRQTEAYVRVVEQRIEAFTDDEGFHLVLCEGLLGLCGTNPKALLEHLVPHVKVGGVLVITCIDAISDHAEVLRRALAQRYITPSMSLQEKVNALRPIFTPHLATLKGMTRSVDDWILDNLLNPASIGPTFSIPDALTQLEGRFEVLGCNPRFLVDWRWYKEAEAGNQWAIDCYWEQCFNLVDYRHTYPASEDDWEGRRLMTMCEGIRAQVAALERGESVDVNTEKIENDPAWFGRGQQYLSLVRVA